jgi:molecular chaperone GrpE
VVAFGNLSLSRATTDVTINSRLGRLLGGGIRAVHTRDVSDDALEAAGTSPSTTAVEPLLPADTAPAAPAGFVEQGRPNAAQGDPQLDPEAIESANQTADPLTRILGTLQELADSSQRYHARAEQREGVIDHLRAEVDRLRRGERRGLLRPLLVEICRLRNDLLRQAEDLPADFDAERARLLLRSYAESVELALEDNGVVTSSPSEGDAFDPRMHRKVGGEPTSDPAVAGRIAQVRRNGYLDVEANTPITPAEVVLFGPVRAEPTWPDLAAATDERNKP